MYYVDKILRPVEAPAKEDIMDKPIKINLQLFAEGEPAAPNPAPVAEPAPAATPAPAPSEPMSIDDQLMNLFNGAVNDTPSTPAAVDTPTPQPGTADGQPATEPPAAPAQPEKIMNKYDTVGDLVKAHQSLQSTWNRDHQALLETQRVLEQIRTEKEQLEARLQNPAPAAQQSEDALDELATLDNEALLEKLMADPKGVITKMVEKIAESKYKPLESKIAPVVEREEMARSLEMWNEATTKFSQDNPDMQDFIDGMKQYIAENNLQNTNEPEKVLKNAYIYAKGLKYAPPVDPSTLLNDPEFVSKNIMTNPAIKDSIIKAYMAELNGVKVPPAITGSSNGASMATPPPAKPNNIEDAGNQFESMLRGNFSK